MTEPWRIRTANGYLPGTIGYVDHPELRVAADIERILNEGAAEGYELDRLEPLRGSDNERCLVVMKRADGLS